MTRKAALDPGPWMNLYEAARAFNGLQPWRLLGDDQVFGVMDPKSGRMGYCCVLGALDELFALSVYRGAIGYDCYKKTRDADSDADIDDAMSIADILMAEFVDWEEVHKEDKAAMRRAGAGFSGPNMFPVFRSTKPGRIPWHIDDAEAFYLSAALKRGSAVFAAVSTGALDLASQPGRILCFYPGETTGRWEDEPALPRRESVPIQVDSAAAMSIRSYPIRAELVWEADAAGTTSVVKGKPGPYFAQAALVVDRASLFLFPVELYEPGAPAAQKAADAVCRACADARVRPARIVVRSQELLVALEPLGTALGVSLERGAVPSLDRVRADMAAAMRRRSR